MEAAELARQARESEAKLTAGKELSQREQLVLLAWLLLHQETRQERRYGQP